MAWSQVRQTFDQAKLSNKYFHHLCDLISNLSSIKTPILHISFVYPAIDHWPLYIIENEGVYYYFYYYLFGFNVHLKKNSTNKFWQFSIKVEVSKQLSFKGSNSKKYFDRIVLAIVSSANVNITTAHINNIRQIDDKYLMSNAGNHNKFLFFNYDLIFLLIFMSRGF